MLVLTHNFRFLHLNQALLVELDMQVAQLLSLPVLENELEPLRVPLFVERV